MKLKNRNRKNSFKKAFKSIDKFIDIESIYDDCIILKNNNIIKGIKIKPIDIWTCTDALARSTILQLRYAFNQFDFEIYQSVVYSPSSFNELKNTLLRNFDNFNEIQQSIVLDDVEKLEEFSINNKKVEFFAFVKGKNEREVIRKYSCLKEELSRVFLINDCSYLDYLTYCNWLFDLDDNFLCKGYYKGRKILSDELANSEIKQASQDIDIEIINDEKRELDIKYSLFDVEEKKDYFKINGKYYSLILVHAFPQEFDVGILNYVARNQFIKTFFKTKRSNLDLVKHTKKESKDLQEKLKTAIITKDVTREEELRAKIQSLEEYARDMINNRDRTIDMSMAFVVSHFEFKEMKYIRDSLIDELKNLGFTVYSPNNLHLPIFKYFNPIFNKDTIISDTLEFNIGFPIGSSSYALSYPYHFSTNEDENGFLYGYEKNMNGRILFNPFLYLDNVDLSVQEGRLTGNIILIGESGSGKTTDLYLFYRYFIRRGCFIMWVDPENKNKKETINNGGTYLEFGSKNHMFNLFQLIRVSTDEDNPQIRHKIMWDSEIACNNAINLFKNVLMLYNNTISDNTLAVVGLVARTMYEKFGFLDYEDENGELIKAKYPKFDDLKNTDFPTLSDFATVLVEEHKVYKKMEDKTFAKSLMDLLTKIQPMLNEDRFMFDGYTSAEIKLKKGGIIGIGTKYLYNLPPNVRQALHYIIYNQAFSYCLDDKMLSAFLYDEAHVAMNEPKLISLADQFNRRSRKYLNNVLFSSQEALDFGGDKEAILNETSYIIIKKVTKKNSLDKIHELLGLDDVDLDNISTFQRGDSYFKCGNKAFYMHTSLTVKEEQSKGNNYYEQY